MNDAAKKIIGWTIFIVYIAVTLYFLFFAGEMGRSQHKDDYAYNLEMFKEITRFTKWARESETGFKAMMINVVGNVACFIPFGILLPINVKSMKRLLSVLIVTFLFSLCVETVQLVTKTGSFDVDDLLLNTLGGIIGYLIYKIMIKCKGIK